MNLPHSYNDKFRPRARKSGEPRNGRDDLIERFRSKLNEEQKRDGRPPFSYARLAKRFKGVSEARLYQLFQECSDPSVRSFGAMLTWQLKALASPPVPPADQASGTERRSARS